MAQGASLVVGRGTKEFWRKALASQDSLGADTPKKKLADAEIIEVSDRYTIMDGGRRLELHELPNQHSDGMLVAYIPHAKLGFQTDIWTGPGVDPMGAQAMPRQRALVELIEKLKLDVTHFIGGHGRIGAYAGLRRTLDGTVPVEESFYLVNNTQEKVDFNVSQNGSYWIPFLLEPGRDARITNGQAWPSAAKDTVMFVNIITGQLRTGDRVETTEKVERGKRYEITSDAQCKCRKLKPL